MNEHIVHFVGNRSPSLYGTVLIDDAPADLTGSTVKLQMREKGSSTLKVDTAAVIVSAPLGQVRYDWAANDVDTAGWYAGWWRVTLSGGQIQDTPEFAIEVKAHAQTGNEYISVGEMKEMLSLMNTTYADADIADAVQAASRDIDERTGQSFYLGTPGEVRYYTPVSEEYVLIDAASVVTAVSANETALVLGSDYVSTGTPIDVLRSLNGFAFPRGIQNGVAVTGTFGYSPVPAQVKQAAKFLANRYLTRARSAPMGVLSFGFDGGAVRLPGSDVDVDGLLAPFTRSQMIE